MRHTHTGATAPATPGSNGAAASPPAAGSSKVFTNPAIPTLGHGFVHGLAIVHRYTHTPTHR